MVAKFLNLNNLSWTRGPFALSNDGRKKWATVCVLEYNHAQESHTCHFYRFFCHICRTTVCWDPQILRSWQRDVTTFLIEHVANNRYGNIKRNLSWGCVGVVSNYNAKPFMGKEDTYHLVTAWSSGKSAGCCNPEAPSFSPLLAAIWICSRINWNTRLITASNKIRHEIPF